MSSSFKPFSGSGAHQPVKGVRVSISNGMHQTSTGISSFDQVLGGGLCIGSTTMIKQDRLSNYANLMLKYFISQGVVADHSLMVISLDSDPKELCSSLMGVSKSSSLIKGQQVVDTEVQVESKPMTRQLGELRGNQMKIAWRYQNNPAVASSLDKASHSNEYYCSSFDLTTKLDLASFKSSIRYIDQDTLGADDENSTFQVLLTMIKKELQGFQRSLARGSSPSAILRIAIDSFGSGFWPDLDENGRCKDNNRKMSCIHFLIALKSLIRSCNAVALITVPAYLYNDFIFVSSNPLIRRMEYACDAVFEVESFAGSPRSTNPLYTSDYTGLFHPIRLPRLYSVTPNSRLSPLDLKSLGFKVQRKKFTIETFHLPPEEGDASTSSGCTSTGGELF